MIIYLWYDTFSSFVLSYYVLLRSLVRWKSLEGGKVAHMSVGAREQAQGREKLRDYRFGQANTHRRDLGACSQLMLRLRVLEELGKGSQATEVMRRISWGLCRVYCISESH